MMSWIIAGWWALAAVGLMCSALFSGLETGLYSLNRVRLQILDHQGQPNATRLRRLMSQPTRLLSTLLIGNNIANYVGTAALTVILEYSQMTDGEVILANVLIVTPLLFVFGETLPKDLFARFADSLMYRFARLLIGMRWLFTVCGLLPLINAFTFLVTRMLRSPGHLTVFHPKRQVGVLVREGVGHGLISDEQSALVERVLALATRHVADEMVPWAKVIKVSINDAPKRLWDLANRSSVSRYPVVDAGGKVRGVVSVYDALRHGRDQCPPIAQLMLPVERLPRTMPSREGLSRLQTSHVAMAVVVDGEKPLGIVTVKDLVEPITGELASW